MDDNWIGKLFRRKILLRRAQVADSANVSNHYRTCREYSMIGGEVLLECKVNENSDWLWSGLCPRGKCHEPVMDHTITISCTEVWRSSRRPQVRRGGRSGCCTAATAFCHCSWWLLWWSAIGAALGATWTSSRESFPAWTAWYLALSFTLASPSWGSPCTPSTTRSSACKTNHARNHLICTLWRRFTPTYLASPASCTGL